jgi:predicted nuclease of predicted toxin-antitoxin system
MDGEDFYPVDEGEGMRVLLDEMYSGLKPFLRLLGWEVRTVEEEGLRGAEDEQVVEQAGRRGLVLVTQEQRVSELAKLRGIPCVLVGSGDIARIVDEKLRELAPASGAAEEASPPRPALPGVRYPEGGSGRAGVSPRGSLGPRREVYRSPVRRRKVGAER